MNHYGLRADGTLRRDVVAAFRRAVTPWIRLTARECARTQVWVCPHTGGPVDPVRCSGALSDDLERMALAFLDRHVANGYTYDVRESQFVNAALKRDWQVWCLLHANVQVLCTCRACGATPTSRCIDAAPGDTPAVSYTHLTLPTT